MALHYFKGLDHFLRVKREAKSNHPIQGGPHTVMTPLFRCYIGYENSHFRHKLSRSVANCGADDLHQKELVNLIMNLILFLDYEVAIRVCTNIARGCLLSKIWRERCAWNHLNSQIKRLLLIVLFWFSWCIIICIAINQINIFENNIKRQSVFESKE